MGDLETEKENFTVVYLQNWLEKSHSQPKEWIEITKMFFECFQLTPNFKIEWMNDVPDDPQSVEAIGYVRQIFAGFINGLSKVNWGNELKDIYELMWTINNTVLDGDEEASEDDDLWDIEQACTIIGEILTELDLPHDHVHSEKRVIWCIRTQKAILFQAISACKVILRQIGLDPEEQA